MKKYFCYNCKEEFDKIPYTKPNECSCGYTHYIVEWKKLQKLLMKRK